MPNISFEGTSNIAQTFTSPMTSFHVFNESLTDSLHFDLGSLSIDVGPRIAWDEDSLPAFLSVTITATDKWQAYAEGPDAFGQKTVNDAILDARLLLNDINADRWSDWELIRCLDGVYRMVAKSIRNWSNTILVKNALLDVNGSVEFPSDYGKFLYVIDEPTQSDLKLKKINEDLYDGYYKIMGNFIHTPNPSIRVYYEQKLPPLKTLTDMLLIPEDFYDILVKYTVAIASGKALDAPIDRAIDADVCPIAQSLNQELPLCRPYYDDQVGALRDYND